MWKLKPRKNWHRYRHTESHCTCKLHRQRMRKKNYQFNNVHYRSTFCNHSFALLHSPKNRWGWPYIMQYVLLAFWLNKFAQYFYMSFVLVRSVGRPVPSIRLFRVYAMYMCMDVFVNGLDIKFIKFNLQTFTSVVRHTCSPAVDAFVWCFC